MRVDQKGCLYVWDPKAREQGRARSRSRQRAAPSTPRGRPSANTATSIPPDLLETVRSQIDPAVLAEVEAEEIDEPNVYLRACARRTGDDA
jgi:hypothetical protein